MLVTNSIFIEMLKQQHQDISCTNKWQSDLFFSFVSGFKEKKFEGFLTKRSSKFQHISSLVEKPRNFCQSVQQGNREKLDGQGLHQEMIEVFTWIG